jgi:small subunit ribosomal protein S20
MPHHKSAEKRVRTSEKRRVRNASAKSNVRKVVRAVRAKDDPTAEDLKKAYSALDKAAKKGVIAVAQADRLKSRLAHRVFRPHGTA